MAERQSVASQFKADPQPKITQRKVAEQAVDPLSARTKAQLLSEGGIFRKLSSALANGGRTLSAPSKTNGGGAAMVNGLKEGVMIEHQRFGVGKVLALEGVGENAKATVEFRNAGTKQLLLKFAKFKVL